MTNADTHAEAYVKKFWPELPEPMQDRLRMAYRAGLHDLRGQAAIAALQGLLSAGELPLGEYDTAANMAIRYADAIVSKLNDIEL